MKGIKILVADDDARVRTAIVDFLKIKHLGAVESQNCAEVLHLVSAIHPDALVLDHYLPDGNALELLPKLKALAPNLPVIILTGNATVELAVRAIKEGAENFITKPVELAALKVMIDRALENQNIRAKQMVSDSGLQRSTFSPFTGSSPAISKLEERVRRILGADTPILIHGETGSGKGVLARWIHNQGSRTGGPFVDLNCAGLSKEFLETELFGHEKGAFTSAVQSKPGLLEIAHHGTVFLDEIGDIDMAVQPKLLKVLEEKQFRRMGDVRDRQVDIRLISASHHDLAAAVRERRFREDLFFRINTITLEIPPLRTRSEDIPALAAELLRRLTEEIGRGRHELTPEALEALKSYSWPGNIRELRNVLERTLLFSDTDRIEAKDLCLPRPQADTGRIAGTPLTLVELERRHIMNVLQTVEGHVASAAKLLDIPVSSLYAKIKSYSITISRSVLPRDEC